MTTYQDRIHQDGRHNARLLPGHKASWTGHTTAHLSILPAALSPATAPVTASSISPWTSGQSVTHPQAHHHLRPTGGLITTHTPGSTPQSSSLRKTHQQTQRLNHGNKPQLIQRLTVLHKDINKYYICVWYCSCQSNTTLWYLQRGYGANMDSSGKPAGCITREFISLTA